MSRTEANQAGNKRHRSEMELAEVYWSSMSHCSHGLFVPMYWVPKFPPFFDMQRTLPKQGNTRLSLHNLTKKKKPIQYIQYIASGIARSLLLTRPCLSAWSQPFIATRSAIVAATSSTATWENPSYCNITFYIRDVNAVDIFPIQSSQRSLAKITSAPGK